MKIRISSLLLLSYIVLSLVVFIFFAYPSLTGKIQLAAYSDALTYMKLFDSLSTVDLIGLRHNFAGPFAILYVTHSNLIAIYILNVLLFLLSINIIFQSIDLNQKRFLFFIMLSAQTLFSLFSVNKEIIAFFTIALIINYIARPKSYKVILIMLFTLLVRWEFLLCFLIFLCLYKLKLNFNRWFLLVGLLLTISVIYPISAHIFKKTILISLDSHETSGTGLYRLYVIYMLQPFGYAIVFIPKILQTFFGLLFHYQAFFDFSNYSRINFWNNFVQFLSSVACFIVSLYSFMKKRLFSTEDLQFLFYVYLIVFCLSPIYSLRYFYPAYILICIFSSAKSNKNFKESFIQPPKKLKANL